MKIIVLGAGLSGITTAWYLARENFDVHVIERQPSSALETSYANGGQISVSHPEPWASPTTPWLALRWLGMRQPPVKLYPQLNPQQWRWIFNFLYECLPQRFHRNTAAIATLAQISRNELIVLRHELSLEYEQLQRGILHFFHTAKMQTAAEKRQKQLKKFGIETTLYSRGDCIILEPALAHSTLPFLGALYAPEDESGNARIFCQQLTRHCQNAGVTFSFQTTVRQLQVNGNRLEAVEIMDARQQISQLDADVFILCTGSESSLLLQPHGIRLPVYPLKGYSVTLPILHPGKAPTCSLTDESKRIVCSRLGQQLRVAGMADLKGYDKNIHTARCNVLTEWAMQMFPGTLDITNVQYWSGLRPATPGNIPLIGPSPLDRLWYNTGHGSLGWTLACGSASVLARLLAGRPLPESIAHFPFQTKNIPP